MEAQELHVDRCADRVREELGKGYQGDEPGAVEDAANGELESFTHHRHRPVG